MRAWMIQLVALFNGWCKRACHATNVACLSRTEATPLISLSVAACNRTYPPGLKEVYGELLKVVLSDFAREGLSVESLCAHWALLTTGTRYGVLVITLCELLSVVCSSRRACQDGHRMHL